MTMRVSAIWGVILTLASTLACHAVPSGLNAMPTANVLNVGQATVVYDLNGSGKLYVPVGGTVVGTQTGLLFGLEAGLDKVTDKGAVYNTKWRIFGETLLTPAFAFGLQNMTPGEKSQPYLVATKSILPMRAGQISGGVIRIERENNIGMENIGMYGAGVFIGPVVVKADRVMGGIREGTSIGGGVTIKNLTIVYTLYNYVNIPDEHTVTLTYGTQAF